MTVTARTVARTRGGAATVHIPTSSMSLNESDLRPRARDSRAEKAPRPRKAFLDQAAGQPAIAFLSIAAGDRFEDYNHHMMRESIAGRLDSRRPQAWLLKNAGRSGRYAGGGNAPILTTFRRGARHDPHLRRPHERTSYAGRAFCMSRPKTVVAVLWLLCRTSRRNEIASNKRIIHLTSATPRLARRKRPPGRSPRPKYQRGYCTMSPSHLPGRRVALSISFLPQRHRATAIRKFIKSNRRDPVSISVNPSKQPCIVAGIEGARHDRLLAYWAFGSMFLASLLSVTRCGGCRLRRVCVLLASGFYWVLAPIPSPKPPALSVAPGYRPGGGFPESASASCFIVHAATLPARAVEHRTGAFYGGRQIYCGQASTASAACRCRRRRMQFVRKAVQKYRRLLRLCAPDLITWPTFVRLLGEKPARSSGFPDERAAESMSLRLELGASSSIVRAPLYPRHHPSARPCAVWFGAPIPTSRRLVPGSVSDGPARRAAWRRWSASSPRYRARAAADLLCH